MEYLRELRNQLLSILGKYRITRIITCSFVIAMIWCFADVISGSYDPNPMHDLICIGLGVLSERFLIWGKSIDENKIYAKL